MKLPHHRKYIHGVFPHFPLFIQKQCACCKHDFVRESMWRFMSGWTGRTHNVYYLCKECAPTKKLAHDYANDFDTRRIMGKVLGHSISLPNKP